MASSWVKRHELSNGLLVRSDLHRLFADGYLPVDSKGERVVVSKRIKEELEDGKDDYKLEGQVLREPNVARAKPSPEKLGEHALTVFR